MKTMCAAWRADGYVAKFVAEDLADDSAGFRRTDADSAGSACPHPQAPRGLGRCPGRPQGVTRPRAQTSCEARFHREYRLLGQFTAPAKVAPPQGTAHDDIFPPVFECSGSGNRPGRLRNRARRRLLMSPPTTPRMASHRCTSTRSPTSFALPGATPTGLLRPPRLRPPLG